MKVKNDHRSKFSMKMGLVLTDTRPNINHHYIGALDRDKAYSPKREKTIFEIQTR